MRRCLEKVAGALMGKKFVSGRARVCVCACVGVGVSVDVGLGVALGAGGGEGLASGLDVAALIARIGRHETTERSACLPVLPACLLGLLHVDLWVV